MEKSENINNIEKLFTLCGKPNELLDFFYDCDLAVPYKDLRLYPVRVEYYIYFHYFVQSLLLPYRNSGDIRAISMSYLDYMCTIANETHNTETLDKITILLMMVLRIDFDFTNDVGICFVTRDNKWYLQVDGKEYNGKEFDEIKKIICDQNAIEIPDETIHPDIIKAKQEMEEYKRKQCKVKMCSFGDQINIIVAKTSYKREEVLQMTIRSFSRLLERIDKIMHYEIMTLLSPNMEKKDRDNIPHYMSASDIDNKYKDIMIDLEQYKNEKGLR